MISLPATSIALVVIISIAVATTRHWLAATRFKDRQQFSDDEFGKAFFSTGEREITAVRVRRVLAENLDIDLGGLRPHDRLDEDLDAQISSNIDLFWQLEEEFRIDCQVDNLEVFEKTTSQLTTFADLVDYVEKRTKAQTAPGEENSSINQNRVAFDWQDVVAYSWFGGIAIFAAGSIFRADWLSTAGLTMALLPITIAIVYEVCRGLSGIIELTRANGLRALLQEPLTLLIWAAVLTSFLFVGAWLSWVLVNLYLGTK